MKYIITCFPPQHYIGITHYVCCSKQYSPHAMTIRNLKKFTMYFRSMNVYWLIRDQHACGSICNIYLCDKVNIIEYRHEKA